MRRVAPSIATTSVRRASSAPTAAGQAARSRASVRSGSRRAAAPGPRRGSRAQGHAPYSRLPAADAVSDAAGLPSRTAPDPGGFLHLSRLQRPSRPREPAAPPPRAPEARTPPCPGHAAQEDPAAGRGPAQPRRPEAAAPPTGAPAAIAAGAPLRPPSARPRAGHPRGRAGRAARPSSRPGRHPAPAPPGRRPAVPWTTLRPSLDDDMPALLPPVRSRQRKSVLLIDDDPQTREAAVAELEAADVPGARLRRRAGRPSRPSRTKSPTSSPWSWTSRGPWRART